MIGEQHLGPGEHILQATAGSMATDPYLKVGWVVVEPVPVTVMHRFVREEITSEDARHHQPVLGNLLTADGQNAVSVLVDEPALALTLVSTGLGAELDSWDGPDFSGDYATAMGTGEGGRFLPFLCSSDVTMVGAVTAVRAALKVHHLPYELLPTAFACDLTTSFALGLTGEDRGALIGTEASCLTPRREWSPTLFAGALSQLAAPSGSRHGDDDTGASNHCQGDTAWQP